MILNCLLNIFGEHTQKIEKVVFHLTKLFFNTLTPARGKDSVIES